MVIGLIAFLIYVAFFILQKRIIQIYQWKQNRSLVIYMEKQCEIIQIQKLSKIHIYVYN